MSSYRWYSVGQRHTTLSQARPDSSKIEILGWSRDRMKALAVMGTIEAYYASSRRMAARLAKADRGFEIEWRKFSRPGHPSDVDKHYEAVKHALGPDVAR